MTINTKSEAMPKSSNLRFNHNAYWSEPDTLVQSNAIVSTIMTTLVPPATRFAQGRLRYSPMSLGRLTSRSMNVNTKGSRIPLAIWEMRMT
jgi:hypothetical protein